MKTKRYCSKRLLVLESPLEQLFDYHYPSHSDKVSSVGLANISLLDDDCNTYVLQHVLDCRNQPASDICEAEREYRIQSTVMRTSLGAISCASRFFLSLFMIKCKIFNYANKAKRF